MVYTVSAGETENNRPLDEVKASSPEIVVNAIVKGVRAGRLVPGQRLVEADLTRNLGVSRGPVREALKRLAAEGVVTLNRNRGAYIRALSRDEVRDMLIVLEALTGLMARLAAKHIGSGENRASFERQYKRLMAFEEQGDSIAFLDQRRDFYDTLIRMGGNGELGRLMPLMQIHLLRLQFQSYVTREQREKQFLEYEAISQAVLAGDQNRAERLMKLHIRRTRMVLERLPEEAYAPGQF
ncbi:MAG: GntR family transcriptional regulator [Nitratireductor sp.]|nr:GntR family transcriptional regulator [Nitratireductor sp.]